MKNLKKYLNGFTLVEILIVVVIVGILAAIAIPTYYNYVKKGYASEAKTQIKSIVQSADMYRSEYGSYPPDCWETMDEMGFIEMKKSVTQILKQSNTIKSILTQFYLLAISIPFLV